MKWKILFAILAVMLLAGCAKPKAEEEAQELIVEEIIEESETVEEAEEAEEPKATTETILIKEKYAEPTELTVVAGSTIAFKSESSKSSIMQVKNADGTTFDKSPKMSNGDIWEITLNEPGEYKFLDVILVRAKGTITVE